MLASRQLYILYNVSFTLTFPLFISYHGLPSETTYPGSASLASVTRKADFFPPYNGQSQLNVSLKSHPQPHCIPTSQHTSHWVPHSTPRIYRLKFYRGKKIPACGMRQNQWTSIRRGVPSKHECHGTFKTSQRKAIA